MNEKSPGKDDHRVPPTDHDGKGNLNDGQTGYSGGADVFSANKALSALAKVTKTIWKRGNES